MKLTRNHNAFFGLAALAGVSVIGRTAEAQLSQFHPSVYGSADIGTRHSQFYLLGLYVGVGGLGWSPYFNVNGYSLHYRLDVTTSSSDRTLSAVSPTLGMAYASRRSGVAFGAGYAWVDNEDPGAPGAEGGGTTGVTGSLGAYHSGTGRRPMRTQFLSNYNFDSRYLWVRGRASVPFRSTRHPARVGLEVVGQGGGRDGRTSSSFAVGPTFEYGWTPKLRTTGGVGSRWIDDGPGRERRDGYLKLEFSFSP
jgi:hypothetical protein